MIFKSISTAIKFFLFLLVLLSFVIHHSLVSLLMMDETRKLKYFLRSIQLTSRIGLWILNVRTMTRGHGGEVSKKLIVANHLSYLDVLVLFSEYPSLFITSTEIRDTFLLGRICRLAGCFFVERRKNRHTSETKSSELMSMKEKLDAGFNIFLFPEGTSSDGKNVLPFKGTFFQLASDASVSVQPICLKYTGPNREAIPWYGDMTFPDHLFSLCQLDVITASVILLPELEIAPKMEMAAKAHNLISGEYGKN